MQPLAFLWFEMQMTQQYLREKTFGPAPSPANSANLNTAIGASRGIGNAIVQEVLRRGARVLRAVRKANRSLATSKLLSGKGRVGKHANPFISLVSKGRRSLPAQEYLLLRNRSPSQCAHHPYMMFYLKALADSVWENLGASCGPSMSS